MQQAETHGFRPIYVARFLAISRVCLFVSFEDLATVGLKETVCGKAMPGHISPLFWLIKQLLVLKILKIYPQPRAFSRRFFKPGRVVACKHSSNARNSNPGAPD